jgi:hypothetical protein
MTSRLIPGGDATDPGASQGVARRAVLRGALLGAAAVTVSMVLPAPAWASAGAGISATGIGKGARRIHGPDGSATLMPTVLGAALAIRTALPAGVVLTLTYDPRLYRLRPDLRLTRVGRTGDVRLQPRHADKGTSQATLAVVVTQPLSPARYELVAGALSPRPYPDDLVAQPAPLRVDVQGADGRRLANQVLSHPSGRDTPPWGATLGAGWKEVALGEAGATSWPALVTLLSTGPAAIPAGASVRVLLDGAAFADLAVTGAVTSDGGSFPGSARADVIDRFARTTWTSDADLPAGRRVSLLLTARTHDLRVPLPYLEPPVVALTAAGANAVQRHTGSESLTL